MHRCLTMSCWRREMMRSVAFSFNALGHFKFKCSFCCCSLGWSNDVKKYHLPITMLKLQSTLPHWSDPFSRKITVCRNLEIMLLRYFSAKSLSPSLDLHFYISHFLRHVSQLPAHPVTSLMEERRISFQTLAASMTLVIRILGKLLNNNHSNNSNGYHGPHTYYVSGTELNTVSTSSHLNVTNFTNK